MIVKIFQLSWDNWRKVPGRHVNEETFSRILRHYPYSNLWMESSKKICWNFTLFIGCTRLLKIIFKNCVDQWLVDRNNIEKMCRSMTSRSKSLGYASMKMYFINDFPMPLDDYAKSISRFKILKFYCFDSLFPGPLNSYELLKYNIDFLAERACCNQSWNWIFTEWLCLMVLGFFLNLFNWKTTLLDYLCKKHVLTTSHDYVMFLNHNAMSSLQ